MCANQFNMLFLLKNYWCGQDIKAVVDFLFKIWEKHHPRTRTCCAVILVADMWDIEGSNETGHVTQT